MKRIEKHRAAIENKKQNSKDTSFNVGLKVKVSKKGVNSADQFKALTIQSISKMNDGFLATLKSKKR